MDQSIIPECYVDTNLVETLVPPISHYNHQKGCGTVTKVMKEKFADRFALGIIDKDKVSVDYLLEFNQICRHENLILHKHEKRHHYIIQIFPAIERFILDCAQKSSINLEEYDLPIDFNKFKKESKTTHSKNDLRFKRLFKSIKESGSPDFDKLSKWISYLKEKNYNVDIEILKAI